MPKSVRTFPLRHPRCRRKHGLSIGQDRPDLSHQTGLVNEVRIRVTDPLAAAGVAQRIERNQLQIGCPGRGARGPAQRLRDPQRHHVHRRRRDPAGGELRHLQHHLDHHTRARDIAIMKSLASVRRWCRRIFVLEALVIGAIGALAGCGTRLCPDDRTRRCRDQKPDDHLDSPAARLLVPALCARSGCGVGLVAVCGLLPGARGIARAPRRYHSGGHMTGPRQAWCRSPARGQRGASDRRRRRHPHPAWRGTDHLGARHRPHHRQQRVRGDHRSVRLRQVLAALPARAPRPADHR